MAARRSGAPRTQDVRLQRQKTLRDSIDPSTDAALGGPVCNSDASCRRCRAGHRCGSRPMRTNGAGASVIPTTTRQQADPKDPQTDPQCPLPGVSEIEAQPTMCRSPPVTATTASTICVRCHVSYPILNFARQRAVTARAISEHIDRTAKRAPHGVVKKSSGANNSGWAPNWMTACATTRPTAINESASPHERLNGCNVLQLAGLDLNKSVVPGSKRRRAVARRQPVTAHLGAGSALAEQPYRTMR